MSARDPSLDAAGSFDAAASPDAEAVADCRRTDRLVTGTVNAFFLEVPLGTQVAFLQHHGIEETKALALAERLEPLGRPMPLATRTRW